MLIQLFGKHRKFIVFQTVEEMDFFQKLDSSRDFDHDLILSNFTHDGTAICECFLHLGQSSVEQCFYCFFEVKPRRRSMPECYVIHRAAITEDSIAVHDENMGGCDRFV